MVEDGAFPGRLHFIAHAIRDISNRLVFVLDPQEPPKRVQYECTLDKIQDNWPVLNRLERESDGEARPLDVCISRQVAERIDKLVESHRERHRRPSNQELLFRFLMRIEPSKGSVHEKLMKDFKKVQKWFEKHAHFRAESPLAFSEPELRGKFTEFERMLYFFIDNFFRGKKELDEILHEANG